MKKKVSQLTGLPMIGLYLKRAFTISCVEKVIGKRASLIPKIIANYCKAKKVCSSKQKSTITTCVCVCVEQFEPTQTEEAR